MNRVPVVTFLGLYMAGAGCAVAAAFVLGGVGPALLAASPFFLILCLIVAIGIARNG